ncbi:uncharacterized protein [Pyxicephalus adspersus]|uniref:uncharacterized protein n=1 Tax=Pyxicephalus adspersus TaxID=30357 RepID=UPI003B5CFC1C
MSETVTSPFIKNCDVLIQSDMADNAASELKINNNVKEHQQDDTALDCGKLEKRYKNVTPVKEVHGGETSGQPKDKGFWVGPSRYVFVALCVFSMMSLIVIIALSTKLFQASQEHVDPANTLGPLRQKQGSPNLSLSNELPTEASSVKELQETLTGTKAELEVTKSDLQKSREEGRSANKKLEKAMQEKVKTENKAKELKVDLGVAIKKLQERENELTRCEGILESVNLRWVNAEEAISSMKDSISDVKQKLKANEDSMSKRDIEISDTKRTIHKVQSDLQESMETSQEGLKKMGNMIERLSDLEDWMSNLEEGLNDLKNKLGGAAQCFHQSCYHVTGLELHHDMASTCSGGWKQVEETCYYFSDMNDVRYKAAEDCKKKNATLAKIQDSDRTLKMMIEKDGRSFWIGLSKHEETWKWSDGSIQMDFWSSTPDLCVKASPALEIQPCGKLLPWICQKKGQKCRLGVEDMRCVGENLGILGEEIPQP